MIDIEKSHEAARTLERADAIYEFIGASGRSRDDLAEIFARDNARRRFESGDDLVERPLAQIFKMDQRALVLHDALLPGRLRKLRSGAQLPPHRPTLSPQHRMTFDMKSTDQPLSVAVLDDYQNVALRMADWSQLGDRAVVTVFNDHIPDPEAVIARLAPFDVLCVMRERTPLPRAIIERLPRLKLIVSTGRRNASIDLAAAAERGVAVANTGYSSTPTIELAWALILASARHVAAENASLRAGGWQRAIGADLGGKTLAVLGLGNIGAEVARIGLAFGMKAIAWSQNLTQEKASAAGARSFRRRSCSVRPISLRSISC